MRAMLSSARVERRVMAERILSATPNDSWISNCRVIAVIECHVPSYWVDSILTYIQPASRIIPSTLQSHNRGAAEDIIVSK